MYGHTLQVGQSDQVLELGHELLLSRELEGHMELKNDVLLSMAMACCNLAGDALEQENQVDHVARACMHKSGRCRHVSLMPCLVSPMFDLRWPCPLPSGLRRLHTPGGRPLAAPGSWRAGRLHRASPGQRDPGLPQVTQGAQHPGGAARGCRYEIGTDRAQFFICYALKQLQLALLYPVRRIADTHPLRFSLIREARG